MLFPLRLAALAASLLLNASPAPAVPHYDHIFVIVDENKDLGVVLGNRAAPAINRFAAQYGVASHYDAVAHPSEPNYVALVGGSTFGIHSDASFLVNSVDAPNLGSELDAAHISWKGYYEDIPADGSLAVSAGLYASKHSGFLNFKNIREDPHRVQHLVGFDELKNDAASGSLPAFALVVPNLCDDMHGVMSVHVSSDCWPIRRNALIARGDAEFATLCDLIMSSPAWKARGNSAIVLVFDEDDGDGREGGGGRVPAIVITNHGPHHFSDATPYTHYSLLRTIEAAFGVPYLGNARTAAPMTRLFSAAP